jgi:predicted nuclease of restriction endonuclease-like RecB superfamily
LTTTKKPRNKFEKGIERQLKRARVSFKYESERIPYLLAGHYIPDFIISTNVGKIYIECKGYFRPEAKRKMVAVKKLNPHLDIRIVFYRATKQNVQWAERNGFRYACGGIPQEWLNEGRQRGYEKCEYISRMDH